MRRIKRLPAGCGLALAVLALHGGVGAAATTGPPYSSTYESVQRYPDSVPGAGTAIGSETVDKTAGTVSVSGSASDTLPVGATVSGNGVGYSAVSVFGEVQQTVIASGSGTIQVVLNNFAGVNTTVSCPTCLYVSGASYVQNATAIVYAHARADYHGAGGEYLGWRQVQKGLHYNGRSYLPPSGSVTLGGACGVDDSDCLDLPPGTAWVVVRAGLYGYTSVAGPAQATLQGSATVTSISTP